VGKSTVLGRVMAARNDLTFSVSATTRSPRPGEQDGVHYYFIQKADFEEMIAKDAFLEPFLRKVPNLQRTSRRMAFGGLLKNSLPMK
jgi:guanylate kinase